MQIYTYNVWGARCPKTAVLYHSFVTAKHCARTTWLISATRMYPPNQKELPHPFEWFRSGTGKGKLSQHPQVSAAWMSRTFHLPTTHFTSLAHFLRPIDFEPFIGAFVNEKGFKRVHYKCEFSCKVGRYANKGFLKYLLIYFTIIVLV